MRRRKDDAVRLCKAARGVIIYFISVCHAPPPALDFELTLRTV